MILSIQSYLFFDFPFKMGEIYGSSFSKSPEGLGQQIPGHPTVEDTM